MSIEPGTPISEVREELSAFVQERLCIEGMQLIGAIVMFETISTDGSRNLVKLTTTGGGVGPLPTWSQNGILEDGMDHESWDEWHLVGVDDDE